MNEKYFIKNSNLIPITANKDKNLILAVKYKYLNEYLITLSLINIEDFTVFESKLNEPLLKYIKVEADILLLDKIINCLTSQNKDLAICFSLDEKDSSCILFKIQQKVKNDFLVNLFQIPLIKRTASRKEIFEISMFSFRDKVNSKIECCQVNESLKGKINSLSNKLINISIDHEQERNKMYNDMCSKLNCIKNDIIIASGRKVQNNQNIIDDDGKSKSYAYSLNDL